MEPDDGWGIDGKKKSTTAVNVQDKSKTRKGKGLSSANSVETKGKSERDYEQRKKSLVRKFFEPDSGWTIEGYRGGRSTNKTRLQLNDKSITRKNDIDTSCIDAVSALREKFEEMSPQLFGTNNHDQGQKRNSIENVENTLYELTNINKEYAVRAVVQDVNDSNQEEHYEEYEYEDAHDNFDIVKSSEIFNDEEKILRCLADVKTWTKSKKQQLFDKIMASHELFLRELLHLYL